MFWLGKVYVWSRKVFFESRKVFLGILNRSGEIIVGARAGVVKARVFRRKGSESERWSRDEIEAIRGTPWVPFPGRVGPAWGGVAFLSLAPCVPVAALAFGPVVLIQL